jgi:hypothetical protein
MKKLDFCASQSLVWRLDSTDTEPKTVSFKGVVAGPDTASDRYQREAGGDGRDG